MVCKAAFVKGSYASILFCFKPFLFNKFNNPSGIYFPKKQIPNKKGITKDNIQYYKSSSGFIYSNRISKAIFEFDKLESVKKRLNTYFDCLLIDEVQDIAGSDFNFILSIANALECIFVGDFYQHTYDTSRDGNINHDLFDNYSNYEKRFVDEGFKIDTETLDKSWRCKANVCDFVSKVCGIKIESHTTLVSEIRLIKDKNDYEDLFFKKEILKLFYDKHFEFKCNSSNWGKCKGLEFDHVCVALSKKLYNEFLQTKTFSKLKPMVRNKLYVAITRTKNDLYLIPESVEFLENEQEMEFLF